jgi:hypothetical protein
MILSDKEVIEKIAEATCLAPVATSTNPCVSCIYSVAQRVKADDGRPSPSLVKMFAIVIRNNSGVYEFTENDLLPSELNFALDVLEDFLPMVIP